MRQFPSVSAVFCYGGNAFILTAVHDFGIINQLIPAKDHEKAVHKMLARLKSRLTLRFSHIDSDTSAIMAESVFYSFVTQLTSPFYQLFATAMGASSFAIGLISSLPSLFALMVMLPVSSRIDYMPDKRKFISRVILVYAVMLPLIACSPWLGGADYWVFIIGISLLNVPLLCYTLSWQSFFSDLFPASRSSVPYSLRMMVTNVVPGIIITVGGLILTYLCTTHDSKIWAYQIFFVLAGLFALLQRRSIMKTGTGTPHVMEGPKPGIFATFPAAFREIKKQKKFRGFLILLFCFYFSWQMCWPMFFIYFVNFCGFSEAMKSIFDVASLIGFGVTATFWGKYISKHGPRTATLIGFVGTALCPFLCVITRNPVMIIISYVISGATSPGFNIGLFTDMLMQLPNENRALNIGVYNTVTLISNFVAPLVGVAIYNRVGVVSTMYISSVVRTIPIILFGIRHIILSRQEKAMAS